MNLTQRYEKEIRDQFDWSGLVQDAKSDGHAFIGTVFSVMPSGKYYTPWAHSNVEPCPMCSGEGSVKCGKANPTMHARFKDQRARLTQEALDKHGAWCDGGWPKSVEREAKRLDNLIAQTAESRQCPRCGGLGSHEAYQDSCYSDALENVAQSFGGWVESGEGDPCDLFFGITTAEEEDDESLCETAVLH